MFDHNETLDEARARNIRDALFGWCRRTGG